MNNNFVLTIKQKGSVLAISLFMMTIVTLFVVTMLKTNRIEFKLGTSRHTQATNFAASEIAAANYIRANGGNLSHGAGLAPATETILFGGEQVDVDVTATEIACAIDGALGSGNQVDKNSLQAVYFSLRAEAKSTSIFSGKSTTIQGMKGLLPPGACNL